jgi:hypothetical protein
MAYVELLDAEATLLEEISDKGFTVAGITMTYAMAIKADHNQHIDWPKVNRAILARWSKSTLDRIKREAGELASPRSS